jgi:hypothetical protein
MGALKPATAMFDGYGDAGAPVEAPLPVAGIVMGVGFVKVCALAALGIAMDVKAPKHTTSAVSERRFIPAVLLL